ncbi:unnamed protein product [Kuraishia capsulata CBS 1993]|uniref:Aminotransferase class I/classII large domain-containing protein n=1 Tax=Kuraishia capsulata CBS 1993 TaxID=1382522 RepID=W6MMW0_9ASCO|nr:uncharacterized protein KUCA_T00002308001 [Kuraishia capsulata CBS 1993]CDK26337.1 unnamed protein product [Kuraishia capsulata CBS 1993]
MSFQHDNLIPERAKSRKMVHFWSSSKLPEGFVPHPEPISLVGGVPHHDFFPIRQIDLHVPSKPFPGPNEKETVVVIPQVSSDPEELDLAQGLQYAEVDGSKQLLKVTRDYTERVAKPAFEDWSTTLTNGSSNGLSKVFSVFLEEGDSILVEEFTFTPVLSSLKDVGGKPVPLKMDLIKGIDIDYMDDLLENWSATHPGQRRPKLLYTIANGHNPLGVAQSIDHKKKILELANKYDFLILEDDPYGYLALPAYEDVRSGLVDTTKLPTNDEFVKLLHPSYLTFDATGRVIRVETFSKVFAPGLRLGYIIAHKNVVQAINDFSMVSTRNPSGAAQLLVNDTIHHWGGIEGWLSWIIKVRQEYVERRNAALDVLYDSKAYKEGWITVIDPKAGMFVAVILNYEKKGLTAAQIPQFMEQLLVFNSVNGVGVVDGGRMSFDPISAPRANFVRITIASAPNLDVLKEAFRRFSKSVQDLFEA